MLKSKKKLDEGKASKSEIRGQAHVPVVLGTVLWGRVGKRRDFRRRTLSTTLACASGRLAAAVGPQEMVGPHVHSTARGAAAVLAAGNN